METSSESTGETLFDPTLFVAATPANPLAPQDKGKAKKTRATSGHGYEKPYAFYDPVTRSLKMYEATCLLGELPSLAKLPPSGILRNGVLFLRPPWEPITAATASSSWPTPTAVVRPMEGNVRLYRAKIEAGEMTEEEATAILGKSPYEAQGKIPEMWPTARASAAMAENLDTVRARVERRGRLGSKLEESVAMWPTPTTQEIEHPDAILNEKGRRVSKDGKNSHSLGLADAVQMWRTPQSNDSKNGVVRHREKSLQVMLGGALATSDPSLIGGKLNPMWVEWLMGFPLGWTDLKDSETPSCPKSPK